MIIGLTGQTGAGKSTVCQFLEQKDVVIIDCDKVAREVTEKGSYVLVELAKAFGEDILLGDGSLNRRELACRAFKSQEKTELLNSITHPAITAAIKEKIAQYPNKTIILDAPTLIESGVFRLCDKIIAVVADKAVRKERILARDNISNEEAERRMSAQKDDAFYAEYADGLIYNNGSKQEAEEKTQQIFKEIGVL